MGAALGGLFCHTGLLLGRCMDAPWMRSYPDIGERAFGRRGRTAVAIMLYAELYLTAVDLLILAGDNLGAVAPGFEPLGPSLGAAGAWTVVATALALPTVWLRSLGLLAWLSALGVVVSFGLTALVGWEGALLGFPHRSPPALRPAGALLALGLVSFNYGGHALFPSLISAMRRRSAYPRVLGATFAAVIAVYIASAALGYGAFGDAAQCAPFVAAARLSVPAHVSRHMHRAPAVSSTDASTECGRGLGVPVLRVGTVSLSCACARCAQAERDAEHAGDAAARAADEASSLDRARGALHEVCARADAHRDRAGGAAAAARAREGRPLLRRAAVGGPAHGPGRVHAGCGALRAILRLRNGAPAVRALFPCRACRRRGQALGVLCCARWVAAIRGLPALMRQLRQHSVASRQRLWLSLQAGVAMTFATVKA